MNDDQQNIWWNWVGLVIPVGLLLIAAQPSFGQTGACCLSDGSCVQTDSGGCDTVGGVFRGEGTSCATAVCTGACCLGDDTCTEGSADECVAGDFQGPGSTCASHCPGPLGTGFTWQGRLSQGAAPVTDTCDFACGLWNSQTGGTLIGTQTVPAVAVLEGFFTLELDFGAEAFDGKRRWLEIAVQCGADAAPVLLAPRQEITAAPHALIARRTPGLVADENGTALHVNDSPALRLLPTFNPSAPDDPRPNIVAGHADNEAGAHSATVSGGGSSIQPNRALGNASTVGGGEGNTASGGVSTVAGGSNNTASGGISAVVGGTGNTASGSRSIVSGGGGNMAVGVDSTVGGGRLNTASGNNSTVGGGGSNVATGGVGNTAGGDNSTIGGGRSNTAGGIDSTVPGGSDNAAEGDHSFAAGKQAKALHNGAFVWADSTGSDLQSTTPDQFLVRAGGGAEFRIGNSAALRLLPAFDGLDPRPNIVIGHSSNEIGEDAPDVGVRGVTISGGGDFGEPNRALKTGVTIGGGKGNTASDFYATVGGGNTNTASSQEATVAGGLNNIAGASRATVAGGQNNTASGGISFVGGGINNIASGSSSTVAGGRGNTASGVGAVVGGGGSTQGPNEASGDNSVVAGGHINTASGNNSTIGGGLSNTASGNQATIPGGFGNTAQGEYSFAAGRGAEALHRGTFVWKDFIDVDFASTAPDQFLIKASGGVGINKTNPVAGTLDVAGNALFSGNVGIGTTTPAADLHVRGADTLGSVLITPSLANSHSQIFMAEQQATSFGMILRYDGGANQLQVIGQQSGVETDPLMIVQRSSAGNVGIGTTSPSFRLEVNGTAGKPGGGSWSASSDRRLKKNIHVLTGALEKLLALHGVSFEYKDPAAINELPGKRIGMVAQDVEPVFPDWVDENARGHKTVTFRGFEALTVEAFRELRSEKDRQLAEKEERISGLEKQNAELAARLERIEKLLAVNPQNKEMTK